MQIPNTLLNNNTQMPSIGFGTWQLRNQDCITTVKTALNEGYTHIDTAEMYLNESEIGQALKNYPREKLFITSKVTPDDLDYVRVLAACQESLARLETDYLDLYLIHWPTNTINLESALKAFKQLYDEKKIKAFGVSNFNINHLKKTLAICEQLNLPLSVNQVEFHPRLYQKQLLDFCNQNKISITSYSPLAMGMVFKDPTLTKIANKHGKSAGQISLRWLLDKNTVIIPKATGKEHIQENLDLDFQLTEEDIKEIDNIDEQQRLVNTSFTDLDY
jgi:diketogulonate reductase-like aldo/keto reductase|tara:strand:+ start:4603 stop:5427 length:825 start_codon:yes stop_codon:yes gene_type:complete